MILNRINFFSKILKNHVECQLLVPNLPDNDLLNADLSDVYADKKEYPLLLLLHGALDDHTSWLRHTNIERYAESQGLAVLMPSGQNSFYTDAVYGLDYYSYIIHELLPMVYANFPISRARSRNYIAGPSMGGYGATKFALTNPGSFAAFACISGALDLAVLKPRMEAKGFDFFRYDLIFGGVENVEGSSDDVFLKVKQLSSTKSSDLPIARVYCGSEDDANYDMNYRLHKTLIKSGFRSKFTGGTGVHDWIYWDMAIKDFTEFLGSEFIA